MRLLRAVCLWAIPALALDNSVTIRNGYTGTLTDHPVWFGRWFAKGEIAEYCRPFSTPSNTGTRAAAAEWQCDVKNRWRDGMASRTITGVRTASPSWSNGLGLTNITVVTGGIATLTTTTPHGLSIGDRLVITGSPSDADLVKDNYTVYEVPSATTAKFNTRFVNGGTYMTNLTVTQALDPMQPNGLRFYSANHGFYKGEEVTITGVGGVAGANGTFTINAVARNEFVVNATGSGTYTGGGTAVGPDYGSVRFALVALKATIPSGGSTRIDFISAASPSSAGDAGATLAAGFDKGEMLAANWGAQFVATANAKSGHTGTITMDARAMLNAWNGVQSDCGPRYWTAGPVLTWLILEYGCAGALTYDYGWKISPATTTTQAITTATQTEFTVADMSNIEPGTRLWFYVSTMEAELMLVTAVDLATSTVTVQRAQENSIAATFSSGKTVGILQYQDAPDANFKSGHPLFGLKFANGWPGAGVRIEAKNWYSSKVQTLWYGVDLKTGLAPALRVRIPEFKHTRATSWQLSTWDGTDPEFYCQSGGGTDPENCAGTGGGTRARKYVIDHNTPYLIYANLLPPYRLYAGLNTHRWLFDPDALSGFNNSDKGALGIGRVSNATASWPGKYLGDGTYGQIRSGSSTAVFNFSDAQEGGLVEMAQALWVQSWDRDGYELNFGDTVPGGAGNVEVESHIPWLASEDDASVPRLFMAGFSEPAFGKELSLYARTTWRADGGTDATVSTFDRSLTACAPTAPMALATAQSLYAEWPCYFTNRIQGTDAWGLDVAHQNDWSFLTYWITGDPRYLTVLLRRAAYNLGMHGSYRNIGRSWAQPNVSSTTVLTREAAWITRAVIRAALATPNTPQFGASAPSVETYYYNEKLWEIGYADEGLMDIQNGNFAAHYPAQFSPGCTGFTIASPDIWKYGRCQMFGNKPNALGWIGQTYAACSSGYPYIICPWARGIAMWMTGYQFDVWSDAESKGLKQFTHERKKLGALMINLVGNKDMNPFLSSTYQSPTPPATGEVFQNISDFYNAYSAQWSFDGTGGNLRFRNHQGFDIWHLSYPMDTNGYPAQYSGAMALAADLTGTSVAGCAVADRPPAGCTGRSAYNWYRQVARVTDWSWNPKYEYWPRQKIENLVVTPGSAGATVSYSAPTGDACYYYAGTSSPNTLDSSDTSDGGGGPARRVVLTGLNPSTFYFLRVTCGTRIPGTAAGMARAYANFTTVTEGPATTIALTLGGAPGAATATVEYGDTAALGSVLGPVACVAGCTVAVPATAGRLLYYRVGYRAASTALMATSMVTGVAP